MSLTEHVDPAIDLIERGSWSLQGGAVAIAYLRSHAFFNQLGPADGCLDSFLGYELDPAADRRVGGEGRPLGAIVGPHHEVAEPLRHAVATTLTAAYLTMMSTEDPPGSEWVAGRDADELWAFWVEHLGPVAPLALGIPDRFVDSVAKAAGAHLESEVKRLGLRPGFLHRRALVGRCAEIGRFGVVLRAGQTAARSAVFA